jgi:hypothetical protein
MAEELDFTLFGDVVIRPSTSEMADPLEVLADKVVRIRLDLSGSMSQCG